MKRYPDNLPHTEIHIYISLILMYECEWSVLSVYWCICVCVYDVCWFGITRISVAICAKCDESVSDEIMLVYDL